MRVVVTGATGNLGTSAVPALAGDPKVDHVVGVARRQPDWTVPNVDFVPCDVRSAQLAGHLDGATALVHLAWAFQPTHQPLKTWDVNVHGSIATFEAAARAGLATIVYASSIGAYSPGPGERVTEQWPTHSIPTAGYGREKAYLERYLDAFELRHPNIRVVRLRPSFVFKRESGSEQRRIFAGPLLPRWLLRPGRLPVLPVPDALAFQAVHADDVADAIRLAVVGEARGAFNVAAEPVIDGQLLGKLLGARTVAVPPAAAVAAVTGGWWLRMIPSEPALLQLLLGLPLLDCTRAHEELRWRPHRTGDEALQEMLGGLANGAGGPTPPLHPDTAAPPGGTHQRP